MTCCTGRSVMILIKSLIAANKSERVKFRIPHSVQQSIPIRCVYPDGIWQVGNKHSKTWRFADVNYAAASEEDRRSIFLSYGSALNALPTDATAKVTIINRRLNPADFESTVLMKRKGDRLDRYRREYNDILIGKVGESNNLVQEKYITLSIAKRKIEDTRAYFRRVDDNLSKNFGRLDSGARPVSGYDCTTSSVRARNNSLSTTSKMSSERAWTSVTSFARMDCNSRRDILRWAISSGGCCS